MIGSRVRVRHFSVWVEYDEVEQISEKFQTIFRFFVLYSAMLRGYIPRHGLSLSPIKGYIRFRLAVTSYTAIHDVQSGGGVQPVW